MRSRLLPIGILAAIVLGLVGANSGRAQVTQTPTPGLNLWIAVDGVPNCDTRGGDGRCDLAPGTTFVIDVYLDPLPASVQLYGGFEIALRHAGVTSNRDASTDSWPDCGFPAAGYDDPPNTDVVNFACAVGVPPAGGSSYSGLIGTISFVCDQPGSISMLHGQGETELVDFDNISNHYYEDPDTDETLTINCVEGGVTPVPTTPRPGTTSQPQATPLPPTERAQATATAAAKATAAARTPANGPGGEDDGDGGLSGGVIAIIVVAVVVVAGGGGFFGWRYLQSRRGGGGT